MRQAEAGMPIKEIGRKHGFNDASFYKWRTKYGGMDVSEAKRLRKLELENGKLKRLLAEAQLDIKPTDVVKSNNLTGKTWLTPSRKPTIFSFGTLQVIEIFAQSRQHKWVICVRKLLRQI